VVCAPENSLVQYTISAVWQLGYQSSKVASDLVTVGVLGRYWQLWANAAKRRRETRLRQNIWLKDITVRLVWLQHGRPFRVGFLGQCFLSE
jgi:hypothetical protein